ncbi:MAG TPA: hypothetical protein VF042_07020 [Gemmatimonadaceae bacterium]
MRKKVLSALILIAACSASSPVSWSEIVFNNPPQEPNEYPGNVAAPSAKACPASLRIADAGNKQYAVWWEVRPDSSAVLMSSRKDAGNWTPSVIADSTDHGVRGCGRPAPAIAADPASGYVHIAYFAEPKSGPGIFFEHSMDDGATFHSPVPIVFGRNPARVSVASNGDKVVVAFEDPNSLQPIIGVALSKTMGHIFEARDVATSQNGHARQPAVRIKGDSIQLWWSEYSSNPSVSATRPMYRAGLWKP